MLEHIHSKNIIHRDIKPENFLIGIGDNIHTVYGIDFGLSKKYKDPMTLRHIPYRKSVNLTGTARYVSVSTHIGIEQSRRDDLESLAYVFIYFIKGSLPWQGYAGVNQKERYRMIMESKITNTSEILCKGLPIEFQTIVKYCRNLEFDADPDYQAMRNCFKNVAMRENIVYDLKFDWDDKLNQFEKKRIRRRSDFGMIQKQLMRSSNASGKLVS